MDMLLLGLIEFISMIGILITFIVFIIQTIRKKHNRKIFGLSTLGFLLVLIICIIITPTSIDKPKEEIETVEKQTEESEVTSETSKPTTEENKKPKEKTDIEKFAEKNDTSVEFAESLKTVLEGMELTDKSKVGVFHYDLSHVYDWEQIEDWANGKRYSAYMDMEHIWYIYEQNDTVVGVRDGHGNVFYQTE